MAAHITQQILAAVAATLVAASTAAGARVYIDHPDEHHCRHAARPVITCGPSRSKLLAWASPSRKAARCSSTSSPSPRRRRRRRLARPGWQAEAALYASETTARLAARPRRPSCCSPPTPASPLARAKKIIAEVRQSWRATHHTVSGVPDAAA